MIENKPVAPNPIETSDQRTREQLRSVIKWSFGLFVAGLFIANALVFFWLPTDALLSKLLIEHFAAIVGMPAAAFMAFAIVWMWRSAEGPVEFEGLSFKFKGASGPIIMWVISFAAIAGAITVSW